MRLRLLLREHVGYSTLSGIDVDFGIDVLVATAEADDMRITCGCRAVTNRVHEFVVRVRDTCPRPKVFVRNFGMHLDTLIDVTCRNRCLLASTEWWIECDLSQDVQRHS